MLIAFVDCSMLDCSVAASLVQLGSWHATGSNPLPIGNRNPVVSPFDNFRCKDNTRLVIAAMKQVEFELLCHLIHAPHLIGMPKYASNSSRVSNSSELSTALELGLQAKTADDWLLLFRKNKLTCAPVNAPSDVFASSQVQFRNMALTSADGKFVIAGNPLKISGFQDIAVRENPPLLNGNRESILAFADAEVAVNRGGRVGGGKMEEGEEASDGGHRRKSKL